MLAQPIFSSSAPVSPDRLEQRRAVRFNIELPVTFTIAGVKGQAATGAGVTMNISRIGALVQTASRVAVGSAVHMDIDMTSSLRSRTAVKLETHGVVVRRADGVFAVSFTQSEMRRDEE